MTTISVPKPIGVDFRKHPRRDSQQPGNPLREKTTTTRTVTTAGGVFAPGHLGELTQIVDFALVDAVPEETGAREKWLPLDGRHEGTSPKRYEGKVPTHPPTDPVTRIRMWR